MAASKGSYLLLVLVILVACISTVYAFCRRSKLSTGTQRAVTKDAVRPEEEIKDPYVLEFLDLKDEYSESDLEEALIRRLETFLLFQTWISEGTVKWTEHLSR